MPGVFLKRGPDRKIRAPLVSRVLTKVVSADKFYLLMSSQFKNLRASELYCPNCRISRPVRERLLLVLPNAEMHEYRCVVCGKSLGTREVKDDKAGIVLR